MMVLRKKKIEEDILSLARKRISDIYERFDHVAVAFSGGKDSTAVLNLTLEEAHKRDKLPLDVVFSDEEGIPYQTENYVRRVYDRDDIDLRWLCMPFRHRSSCSPRQPFWFQWNPDKKEKWVREMPAEGQTEFRYYDYDMQPEANRVMFPSVNSLLFPNEKFGKTAFIMGIRAQESITRYWMVARRKKDNYITRDSGLPWGGNKKNGYIYRVGRQKLQDPIPIPTNVWKVYPIYDWMTSDVWTAPKKLDWDYNKAYDLMDKHGITPSSQRVCPPFHREATQSLDMFKTCFPEIWEKLHKRVEGASTAARYGKTELYGFSGKLTRPDNCSSYRDYIKTLLKEKTSNKSDYITMIKIVKTYIGMHYNKTDDKLTWQAHWFTGIGWEFLAKKIIAGDYVDRMQARTVGYDANALKKMKEQYEKSLEKDKERGIK